MSIGSCSSIIGTRAITTQMTIIVIKILSLSGFIDLYMHACWFMQACMLTDACMLLGACMLNDACMHVDIDACRLLGVYMHVD